MPISIASRGCSSAKGSAIWEERRALLPGARHRVPLVADAAGVQREGIVGVGAIRSGRFDGDEACLAVGVEEATLGEEAGLSLHRGLQAAATGKAVVRHRTDAFDTGIGTDVEVAAAVVLEGGEGGVFGEDLGMATGSRRLGQSPSGGRPRPAATNRRALRPVHRGRTRWREMRRSELVTVPLFSPQPSDGRRTWA